MPKPNEQDFVTQTKTRFTILRYSRALSSGEYFIVGISINCSIGRKPFDFGTNLKYII